MSQVEADGGHPENDCNEGQEHASFSDEFIAFHAKDVAQRRDDAQPGAGDHQKNVIGY
jgi:hypothetical protein